MWTCVEWALVACLAWWGSGASQKGRWLSPYIPRPLPSVSHHHFQELSADGTYRWAYTGEKSYHAERRLADGRVEGETLYVRPDGVPVKVEYYADAKSGYRPMTQVLYAERLLTNEASRTPLLAPLTLFSAQTTTPPPPHHQPPSSHSPQPTTPS